MKTAIEIRAIATRVKEEEQTRVRNRALDVLENKIAPQIEMAANEGRMAIKYTVDADVDIEFISDELTKIGYEASYLGCTMEIYW